MSTNQTGHKQNVVNLGVMIARVSTFGTGYNPSNNELAIASLTQLKTKADAAIDVVTHAEVALKNQISVRVSVFEPLDSLVTSAINALRISGALPQTIEQAETIVRELRAKRAPSGKSAGADTADAQAKAEEKKQVASHNATYDSKVENFDKFIKLLTSVPEYKPNETVITPAGLQARLTAMAAANYEYSVAEAALDAARLARRKVLYSDPSALVKTALAVKTYVKSAFGASSPQYKEISSIVFENFEA